MNRIEFQFDFPVIQGSRGLYDYLQTVRGYIAPPIFVVFFFGIFHKRLSAKGAITVRVVGFILGLFRLAIDTPVTLSGNFEYREGSFCWIMNNTFFQYYRIIIFIISALCRVIVSYATEAPAEEKVLNLTMSTVTAEQKALTKASYGAIDSIASVVVMVLIIAAYLYFTG